VNFYPFGGVAVVLVGETLVAEKEGEGEDRPSDIVPFWRTHVCPSGTKALLSPNYSSLMMLEATVL